MSSTVYENPAYYKGPIPQLERVRAKNSQTWKAGMFARRTDSGLVKCKTNAATIQYLTAQDQITATSSSDVYVYKIPSTETQFKIYASNANNDTKALAKYISHNQGLAVNDCICTISHGNDSNEILHIEDIYANKDKFKTDTSNNPGAYIVSVTAAGLTAEGSGM